jgi:uncharacterized membrane protein HdeD (DUF308 family)
MIRMLIRNWWLLLVRGIFAVFFALFIFFLLPFVPAALLRPLAFAGLVVIFSVFAIVTGIITIAAAVSGAGLGGSAWLLLADGIAVTIGGLVLLLSPVFTLFHVVQLIAATTLLVGMLELLAGFHLRRHVTDEWLLVSGGLISIAFAACLFLTRGGDVQSVLTWIAIYAVANGLAMAGLALRLRTLRHNVHALAGSQQVKSRIGAA